MKSQFLSQLFTNGMLTSIGLALFFLAFLGLSAWVFLRRDAKAHYEQMSELPLQEVSYERG